MTTKDPCQLVERRSLSQVRVEGCVGVITPRPESVIALYLEDLASHPSGEIGSQLAPSAHTLPLLCLLPLPKILLHVLVLL